MQISPPIAICAIVTELIKDECGNEQNRLVQSMTTLKRECMSSSIQHLSLIGLRCPLPVLQVKKALANVTADTVLEVIVDDPNAPDDLAAFCRQTGHRLLVSEAHTQPTHRIVIQKKPQ